MWLGILGGLAAVLGGGVLLMGAGYRVLALAVLALPAIGALLLFAFIMISNPRWN